MAASGPGRELVDLDTRRPVWDRFFMVAPLVLIGTTDADGALDLAPKHMVTPLGWENHFGFVCAPSHSTCRNVERTGVFSVSFPRPSQVLYATLAASPRQQGEKPVLDTYETIRARSIDGGCLADAYLYFECRSARIADSFGPNCLIAGDIVAAYADPGFLRKSELDDQELVHESPLLVYLAPGRFASVDRSNQFPFPTDMKK